MMLQQNLVEWSIAMDHTNKTAIVGLKGTSSLADVMTDLLAVPEVHSCNYDEQTSKAFLLLLSGWQTVYKSLLRICSFHCNTNS